MESEYIYGHLLIDDILSALTLFILRGLIDLLSAQKIVNDREGPNFSIYTFYYNNRIGYLASFVATVGLLISLPEGLIILMEEVFDKEEFYWNTFFSAVIGYAPIEILLFVKKKVKRKAKSIDEKF